MPKFVDDIQMKSSATAEGSTITVIDTDGNVNCTGLTEALATVAGSTGAGTALPNSGISLVGSTASSVNYVLADPVAGVHKKLICTAGSTDNTSVISTSTSVTFDGSHSTATMNAAGDLLDLIGLSTTRWQIITNGGSVALS